MPAIFSANIATHLLMPKFSTMHASTEIPVITLKIARQESALENRTFAKNIHYHSIYW
ncbi:hypothetical protein [Burkholderia sp. Bp9143]|uniref:hypothetical protein n=1 Tax=Burkholderia sp. Bp9143 TaxID=2184574 RepID=UPI0016264052|nr:hypothetical protein [Burkholderia sp. Bp9143]